MGRLGVALHLVEAGASALASAWIAAVASRVVSPATAENWRALTALSIALVAVDSLLRSFGAAWNRVHVEKVHRLQEAVRSALDGTLGVLAHATGVARSDLGASVWLVRWLPRWPFVRKQLWRVARVRGAALPGASPGIHWTRGKGIIGRCWRTQNLAIGTPESAWKAYSDVGWRAWRRLPPEVTFDLKFRDFQRLRGKYAAVVAVPIVSNEEFVGCVAFDARVGVDPEAFLVQDAIEVAGDTAATVATYLSLSRA